MVEDISASDRWVIPASALQRIPGCAGGEAPLSVQLLHGGRNVNRNLRIDTRVGRFVLRQRIRDGPRPGADPLREVACHRAAAAAGMAPAVLEAAPDCSWILMDYVEGGTWTPPRLQAPEGLRTLGAHNAPQGPRGVRSGVHRDRAGSGHLRARPGCCRG